MKYDIEQVCEVRNVLGEGPIWDEAKGILYWTDIDANRYHLLETSSARHESFEVGTPVGAIALREGEGLLFATKEGFAFAEGSKLDFLRNPEAHLPETRFNDGAVDPEGRFWAGSYGAENNTLYRLDPDLSIHRMETGIGVPNGIGWDLAETTMYFTDSRAKTIYAYDYDSQAGTIENRRAFIRQPEAEGVPDGLIVDAEGFLWSAWFNGWRLERYDPEGKLERTIPLPVQRPTSMVFGGENLDELYVTSASFDVSHEEQPLAGHLFRLRPGPKGRLEYRFKG